MQDTHDPFSYLLHEIRAYDAGLREDWDPYQRDHYLGVLLIEEAQEIAWGRRHLTVVHGEAVDDIEAELLDELFATWEEIAAHAAWARIGGVPDQQMSLSISGPGRDAALASAINQALQLNPGAWRIIEGVGQ
jgi:NTP pyrophosphatase (non-canonical NTP hydrolase)